MADALNDEFYFSDGKESIVPQDILEGDAQDSDLESITSSSIVAPTTQGKPQESSINSNEVFIGHTIHPDRMNIPTLKRHADEQEKQTLDQKEDKPKKSKKQRLEDIIPISVDGQLAHLLRAYAKYKKPTAFENDNITKLTVDNFIDSTQHTGSLQSLIQASIPNWEKVLNKKFNKHKGCPRVIILSISAVRCIELVRTDLPHLHRIHTVAKLFAKHKKIQDHVDMLEKTVVRIACGTPGRIVDLQKEEGINLLKECQIIVLDMAKDGKMRDVLSSEECSMLVMEFLDSAMPCFDKGLKLMFKY